MMSGRVTVNGQTVPLGTRVDPVHDQICVDGKPVRSVLAKHYYLFHKPRHVLVSRRDPQGRPLIYDWLQDLPVLVRSAGRLDFDSEGLLLLTNDGSLIQRLTHPSKQVIKRYHVKVAGAFKVHDVAKLKRGIPLSEGLAQAYTVCVLRKSARSTWLEIALTQGWNRQIRRMLTPLNYQVLRLRRVAIGPFKLGRLRAGEYRELAKKDLSALPAQF